MRDIDREGVASLAANPEKVTLQRVAIANAAGDFHSLTNFLNLNRLFSLMAVEDFLGKVNGYTFAKNNYLICVNAESGQVEFVPKVSGGWYFGAERAVTVSGVSGGVCKAILSNPEASRRYSFRRQQLATGPLRAENVREIIDRGEAIIAHTLSPDLFSRQSNAVARLKREIGQLSY
jgi:hypothetical protein